MGQLVAPVLCVHWKDWEFICPNTSVKVSVGAWEHAAGQCGFMLETSGSYGLFSEEPQSVSPPPLTDSGRHS